MTRLETFGGAPPGFGAPRSSWYANLWHHAITVSPIGIDTVAVMNSIVSEYGATWSYAERTDSMVPIWPEYLDFADEGQATAFLLRWS